MKYQKPKITFIKGELPPITTNFAPPPVEERDSIEFKKESNNDINIEASESPIDINPELL